MIQTEQVQIDHAQRGDIENEPAILNGKNNETNKAKAKILSKIPKISLNHLKKVHNCIE